MPLLVSTTAFTLALLGTTVLNVALPAIRRDLGGGVTALQWVANGYSLMLASLLLTMGALCDQRGARRVLLAGLGLFGAGATLGVAAPSLPALVVAQLALGAGAAALTPASLTVISHAYADPVRRARAIAIYSSASAAAIAAGPVVGGVLIDAVGWRAVFAFYLPVVAAIAVLALSRLDETPFVPSRHLDPLGQATAVLALGTLTLGFIGSGNAGWGSARTLVPLVVAVAAGVAFLAVERRGTAPMLPLELFRGRAFSIAVAIGLLVNFAVYGLLFVLSLYMQEVRGLSPLETGLAFAALASTAAAVALPAARATARTGARGPAALGGALAATGAVILLASGTTSPLWLLIAGLVVLGSGGGTIVPALTAAIVMETDPPRMGVAAATFTASRQAGGMLGVAVLGATVGGGSFVHGMRLAVAVAAAALAVCVPAALLLARGGRSS